MKHQQHLGNALLWAAAIVAASLVHAPPIMAEIILPALAAGSLFSGRCRN